MIDSTYSATIQPSLSTMLTPDDIEFIKLLIDERIKAGKAKRTSPAKNYHTVNDIRALIRETLPEFKQWAGGNPFPLDMLRFFLRTHTTLMPGDQEGMVTNKKSGSTVARFDTQVANALNTKYWPDCPFMQVRTGYYQLIQP